MWSETDSDKITAYKTAPRTLACVDIKIAYACVEKLASERKKVTLCYFEAKIYWETVYTLAALLLITTLFLIYCRIHTV